MKNFYPAGYKPVLAVCILAMGLLMSLHVSAQNGDTLHLTLQQAETRFMENNLSLLAARYNIDANKALVEQAKLWDNPVLVTDQNIYANHRFFEHGTDANGQPAGQYFIQLQQLIKTAGKRSKWIAMAATNARLSELQFDEVLRNLKYQLRNDYYTINQLAGIHQLYEKELITMQSLLTGMDAQLQAGNIAKKDHLRIQALVVSTQQELAENDKQLADAEADLKTLLGITGATVIVTNNIGTSGDALIVPNPEQILDTARRFNASYAIETTNLLYQQQNLSYQKALRAPDLTVGPEYDHNSNYTPHYVGLSISLPLNIFNKNQGNIKSAQFAVKQEEANLLQVQQQLQNEIQNALQKFYLTQKMTERPQQAFYADYEKMFNNISESYRQRQISLLEFIDFFDGYQDTRLKALQQSLNLQLAKEELNFIAGKDIIH